VSNVVYLNLQYSLTLLLNDALSAEQDI